VPARRAGDGAATPVIAFGLGGERYAIEAAAVREVIRPPRLARLPGAPAFAAGVVNLRGEIVTVLDLRPFLGVPAASPSESTRLVVLGGDVPELALVADAVEGLAEADLARLAPAPESAARARPEYVRGVTASGVAVLDGAAILRDPRLVVDDGAAPAPEVP
jgi:purine-binding chemotaxis protein CheW